MRLCFTLCGTWAMLHARSRDRIRKNGKISGFGARAEAEGLDCRARRSWLDRLVGQPRRRGLSNLWYGAQSPARLICPAASGLAGARDVGLDPGHVKGRRLAPGATLHMSQNGMWGDRHAQAGQRPSSTQRGLPQSVWLLWRSAGPRRITCPDGNAGSLMSDENQLRLGAGTGPTDLGR
jgi:hypothetical protein